jgi:hypothetical protein
MVVGNLENLVVRLTKQTSIFFFSMEECMLYCKIYKNNNNVILQLFMSTNFFCDFSYNARYDSKTNLLYKV